MMPWVSKAKRHLGELGSSSNQGKRDAEGCVGNGWQRCAERCPAPTQEGAGTHWRRCFKTQIKASRSNSCI